MDRIISQYDHRYLQELLRYNKALAHRNALLKRSQRTGDTPGEELELYEERMSEAGRRVRDGREAFVASFVPTFRAIHERIANEDEVSLEFRPSGSEDLMKVLQENREKDLVLGYTSLGPHKEDLRFGIQGANLKKFGSQGQQKSFVLALKLAQYRFIHEALGKRPVLMLDDLFDKLDGERMKKLLELVSEEEFGQILISDTEKDRLENVLADSGKEVRSFEVQEGKVRPWNTETTSAL